MALTAATDAKSNPNPLPEDIFWLIEIANTTLVKDLGVKKNLYARSSILEYWVMNLQTSELIVFRDLSVAEYRSATRFDDGHISPLAFPDISIEISRLFR